MIVVAFFCTIRFVNLQFTFSTLLLVLNPRELKSMGVKTAYLKEHLLPRTWNYYNYSYNMTIYYSKWGWLKKERKKKTPQALQWQIQTCGYVLTHSHELRSPPKWKNHWYQFFLYSLATTWRNSSDMYLGEPAEDRQTEL